MIASTFFATFHMFYDQWRIQKFWKGEAADGNGGSRNFERGRRPTAMADPEIFKGGGGRRQCVSPLRTLSQMHMMNFIRVLYGKKATYWTKNIRPIGECVHPHRPLASAAVYDMQTSMPTAWYLLLSTNSLFVASFNHHPLSNNTYRITTNDNCMHGMCYSRLHGWSCGCHCGSATAVRRCPTGYRQTTQQVSTYTHIMIIN